jgi:hypothetical protein
LASLAAGMQLCGKPTVLPLYRRLLTDVLLGVPKRSRVDLGNSLGMSQPSVFQVVKVLERWGLLEGPTLHELPKLTFVEDLLQGAMHDEELQSLLERTGHEDLRRAQVDVAAVLLRDLTEEHLVWGFGAVPWGVESGMGYLSMARPEPSTEFTVAIGPECYTAQLDWYGLGASPKLLSRGKVVKRRADLAAPPAVTSQALWGRSHEVLRRDAYFDQVVDVLAEWTRHTKRAVSPTYDVYVPVRMLLSEEGMTVDQVKRAVKAATLDPYWRGKGTAVQFFKAPSRVKELSQVKSTHDPLGRGYAPGAEYESMEF